MIFSPGAPYFGTELCAHQGDGRHKHFEMLAKIVMRSGIVPLMLEVGSWAGMSLAAWNLAFQRSANFVVVDAWKPYFEGESAENPKSMHAIMNAAAESNEIFDLFMHNIKVCGMSERVKILRGDSQEILPSMADEYSGKFDLIFIDGDHRYGHVVCDIWNSMPLVREGGILCGDDLEAQLHELNDPGAHKLVVAANTDHVALIETRRGTVAGYHPGVCQAVYEVFGPVSCFDGLWAMRRTASGWEQI